ncbi:DNA polymerase IV [Nocardioides sp. C4-1]|uniref:DNA polymerase IV n=1 Tax=Nocardioides sp. C4-1 TaxID=3151851 RepID=UPI00326628C9
MPVPVLHVDLDQFLAAVEVLRRPELAGLPVVVGGRGDPTERGVVSTASYEARAHGVRSGMPLRTALKRCPGAVFLPVDFPAYEAKSSAVMATLRAAAWHDDPVDVEMLGWDEAFVGLRPGFDESRDHDPMAFADQLRAEVLAATGLHCSVGVGDNKLQAKIATDFGKPRGVYRISDATWSAEMGHRPTRALWGVGSKIQQRLAELGIDTVEQLAASDVGLLAAEIGPTMGPWYHRLGRGVDPSPVDPTPWVARAHGREETFQTDLDDDAEIEATVRRITERVVADIDAEGRPAWRVGLKVRDRAFQTVNRSRKLPDGPTNDPVVLGDTAVALLAKVERRRPVRLIGVRLEMVEPTGGYPR